MIRALLWALSAVGLAVVLWLLLAAGQPPERWSVALRRFVAGGNLSG